MEQLKRFLRETNAQKDHPGNEVRPANGPGRNQTKAYRKPEQIKLLQQRDVLREEDEKPFKAEPGAVDAQGRALPQYIFPGMEKATEAEAVIHKSADAATKARIEADLEKTVGHDRGEDESGGAYPHDRAPAE